MSYFSKFSLFLFATLFTLSCKKDDKQTEDPKQPVYEVAGVTSNWFKGDRRSNAAESKITYDKEGRIVLGPLGTGVISFEYYSDKITVKYSNPAPNTVTDYFTLDEKGRIKSLVRKALMPWDIAMKDYVIQGFEYNSDGFLSAIVEDGKKVEFTYSNGNLMSFNDKLKGDNGTTNFVYTDAVSQHLPLAVTVPIYHINSLHRTPTPINVPFAMAVLYNGGYYGRVSKNQVSEINTPLTSTSYRFIYTKDDNGHIVKMKETGDTSIDYMEHTFRYVEK
ncbi:DUF4595 domain-containing protein [Pedobacter cryoconitis]|uniref:DUF4595 domain-containing protein n=1 Tax=Pedobacter cryoconitis TaxID=188932 RepID=UPI0016091CF8|nr:DUF4595 domain-containing protein [Pedobacter cryoconitis]MBB5645716.1 hypothetical protein [Pedobacter cryoconitis]